MLKVGLEISKPLSTPMVPSGVISKTNVDPLDDTTTTQFKSLVGNLQYCYITQLELSYCWEDCVNSSHVQLVCIIKHLKECSDAYKAL